MSATRLANAFVRLNRLNARLRGPLYSISTTRYTTAFTVVCFGTLVLGLFEVSNILEVNGYVYAAGVLLSWVLAWFMFQSMASEPDSHRELTRETIAAVSNYVHVANASRDPPAVTE